MKPRSVRQRFAVSDITSLLAAMASGDTGAGDRLLPLVYDQLRSIAAANMAKEAPDHILQPTALVNEAWLRLAASKNGGWQNRAHFIGAAAEAMRRILVDDARSKLRKKRGGDKQRVDLDDCTLLSPIQEDKVLQVSEALEVLEKEDRERAEVVKLRFFVGMSNEEIAALTGVNEKTVRPRWELAKVRLYEIIISGF